MIKRNIDKNSWRLNLPAELMEQLNWNKGDALFLKVEDDKLVLRKATDEEVKNYNDIETIKTNVKNDTPRYYPNGKKVPPKKKTPCGLFEFTKRKYADNKCKKCNANYELLMQNPGIYCSIAEQNTKEITEEIAKNLNDESKITAEDFKNVEIGRASCRERV